MSPSSSLKLRTCQLLGMAIATVVVPGPVSCERSAMPSGSASLIAPGSTASALSKVSVSRPSFRVEASFVSGGTLKISRSRVGRLAVRRPSGRRTAWLARAASRARLSASRSRSEISAMTSGGGPGRTPFQFSGNRSMKARSPASIRLAR